MKENGEWRGGSSIKSKFGDIERGRNITGERERGEGGLWRL